MDDPNSRRTGNIKHTQLETLVSYMENFPYLAVIKKEKLSKSHVENRKAMWMDLHVQLNAVPGGTQKTLEQWRKAWTDQKAKTYAKAMRLIETGGKSTYLTPLEERILKILSLTNEFKSPQPSSDVFLIPETGIVFSLPRVAQDASQPSVSSTPSSSQDTPLVCQEMHDPIISESNNISVVEVLPNVAVVTSFNENPLTTQTYTLANPGPLAEAPVIILSSTDMPYFINQESQDKINLITKSIEPVTECSEEIVNSVANYSAKALDNPSINVVSPEYPAEIENSAVNYPSSTTACSTSKATFGKAPETFTLANPEPLPQAPVITLSSTDIPYLIKEENQEKINLITKSTEPVTECSEEIVNSVDNYSVKISEPVNNPSINVVSPEYPAEIERSAVNYPSSTTACSTSKASFRKGRRRRRDHLRSHYMTADKAAETFGYISERNCAVLERIASAIEAQANRAAKQTQLMREIIDFVKRR